MAAARVAPCERACQTGSIVCVVNANAGCVRLPIRMREHDADMSALKPSRAMHPRTQQADSHGSWHEHALCSKATISCEDTHLGCAARNFRCVAFACQRAGDEGQLVPAVQRARLQETRQQASGNTMGCGSSQRHAADVVALHAPQLLDPVYEAADPGVRLSLKQVI